MDLSERVGWLLLGCAIGFVLGYIVRSLREIKEELDEVDECVKRLDHEDATKSRKKDEGGFSRYPLVLDVILLFVVAMTVWASFASQKAANTAEEHTAELEHQQTQLQLITYCNQYFLTEVIDDLNERTTYSTRQADANVELIQAQAEFLSIVLIEPPVSREESRAALQRYFRTLTDFTTVQGLENNKRRSHPFPSSESVEKCFDGEQIPTPKEKRNDG